MKEIKTKYCAIKYADNGTCEQVLECKNLTKKEYAKLKNESISNEQEKLKEKKCVDKRLDSLEKHSSRDKILIAKSIYDNFVDRGLIEDDIAFQNAFFNHIFKGEELSFGSFPKEFEKIWDYVCGRKEEE